MIRSSNIVYDNAQQTIEYLGWVGGACYECRFTYTYDFFIVYSTIVNFVNNH